MFDITQIGETLGELVALSLRIRQLEAVYRRYEALRMCLAAWLLAGCRVGGWGHD